MKYTSHPADIESHAIHALETEVRKCDRYAANPENDDVVCISVRIGMFSSPIKFLQVCELRAWALAMVVSSSLFFLNGQIFITCSHSICVQAPLRSVLGQL
jgi:hypothetical protein